MYLIPLALMVVKSPPLGISIPVIRCLSEVNKPLRKRRLLLCNESLTAKDSSGRLRQKKLVAQPAGTRLPENRSLYMGHNISGGYENEKIFNQNVGSCSYTLCFWSLDRERKRLFERRAVG